MFCFMCMKDGYAPGYPCEECNGNHRVCDGCVKELFRSIIKSVPRTIRASFILTDLIKCPPRELRVAHTLMKS